MAASGWYPDPSGTPGRFRYWDGNHWSGETTDNPNSPPPASAPTAPGASSRRRPLPLLIGAVVLVIIVVVIAAMIIRAHRSSLLTDPDPPQSTASGWDDSSPLPTASPTPSPSPSASGSNSAPPNVPCPEGDPFDRAAHPQDNRVYGGQLSFPKPTGAWQGESWNAGGLSFAHDVGFIDQPVEPEWYTSLSVGKLLHSDGFGKPRQSANAVYQCIASSIYYRDISGSKQLTSAPITLDGHPGWRIRGEIRVDDPEVQAAGDVVEIRVIDTGQADGLSFFWGCAPIGDSRRIATLDTAVGELRVG